MRKEKNINKPKRNIYNKKQINVFQLFTKQIIKENCNKNINNNNNNNEIKS